MLNTVKVRAEMLMAMHDAVINLGDEELYMDWVTLAVPDEPTPEDFYDIAEDENFFEECSKLFRRLVEIDEANNY